MLIYESRVRDELDRVRKYAERLEKAFEAGRSSDDLLQDVDNLEAIYENLLVVLPDGVGRSNMGRHLYFMDYYLKRDDQESCRGDVRDILNHDLPEIEENFREWVKDAEHYDESLRRAVSELIARREYDSAIRKAFVILKERLVHRFQADHSLDGADLVNSIFGSSGTARSTLETKNCEAWRNLLDGLYGVFRNRFAHRDVETSWAEADGVISMLNIVLKKLDEMSNGVPEGGNGR